MALARDRMMTCTLFPFQETVTEYLFANFLQTQTKLGRNLFVNCLPTLCADSVCRRVRTLKEGETNISVTDVGVRYTRTVERTKKLMDWPCGAYGKSGSVE